MINTSGDFKTLMESNVRPKCEPIIRVSGKDSQGNDVFLEWKGKDIKNLTYKRSIDILGREIPSMELTWTEIYTGKLNAQAYPEKYNNISKYMSVELLFVQDLPIRPTWRDCYEGNIKWDTLFTYFTWRKVFAYKTETVSMPKMFLVARPTISGKTITWKAADVLYFLDEPVKKSFFASGGDKSIAYRNPVKNILINARGSFSKTPAIFDSISKSINGLDGVSGGYLDKSIIVDSSVKDFLKNYASFRNYYVDFKDDYFVYKSFTKGQPSFYYNGKIMKAFPLVNPNPDISQYVFQAHILTKQDSTYSKVGVKNKFEDTNYDVYEYFFDGYGEPESVGVGASQIDYALSFSAENINVVPISYDAYEQSIPNPLAAEGEPFVEDNPLYPYQSNHTTAKQRLYYLRDYFNNRCASLEFEGLPNVSIEPGDVINVETNLYNGNDRVIKNVVVVAFEMSYNGALTEKIKAHEVLL